MVKDEGFLNQRQDAIAAAAITSGVTKVIMGSGRKVTFIGLSNIAYFVFKKLSAL